MEAAVARTGVLEYSDGDRTWREYRPAEEVFAEDSVATLRGAVVTDDHPEKLVTPENFKAVTCGNAEGAPRRDGSLVVVDLMVQDAALCELVKAGSRKEVSCGYTCEVEHSPGVTPEGEKYDAIQRRIRHNHIALLPPGEGRSGPEVSLRLDGAARDAGVFRTHQVRMRRGDQLAQGLATGLGAEQRGGYTAHGHGTSGAHLVLHRFASAHEHRVATGVHTSEGGASIAGQKQVPHATTPAGSGPFGV